MKVGDSFEIVEGAAALLLCAKCKQPVKAGDNHQCGEDKHESSEKKENAS